MASYDVPGRYSSQPNFGANSQYGTPYSSIASPNGSKTGGGGSGAGLSAMGGVYRAMGSIYSGYATQKGYKAKAAAKEIEAGQTIEQGLWDQERLNDETRRTLATQRMIFGQAGVTLEGAPESLQRATNEQYVLERMMKARNTRQAAEAMLADAREFRKAGQAAMNEGVLGAFGSFF